MAEKRKRKTLPPRGDPKLKVAVTESIPTRQRLGAELDEREEFGENTFAGALQAVKHVLESASGSREAQPKPKKK